MTLVWVLKSAGIISLCWVTPVIRGSNFLTHWHHVSILITMPRKDQHRIYSCIHFLSFSLSSSLTVSLDVWPLVLFVLFLSLTVPPTHFVPAYRISVSLNYYKEELIVWLSVFLVFILRDSCAATIHYPLYLLNLFWLPSIGAVKLVYYNIGKHLVSDGCHIQLILTLFTVCILSCQIQDCF